jgi:ParB family chromosome partitioning protein
MQMQIPIDDIKVKKRLRTEYGDIHALAESMKRFGQISPIVLNTRSQLVAGGRRLEAARYLGWRTINAVVMDIDDKVSRLEYEIEENIQRRDFTPEEAAAAARELARLKHPGFFRKLWNAIVDFFRRLFRLD